MRKEDEQLTKQELIDDLEENIECFKEAMEEYKGSRDEDYFEGQLEAYDRILSLVKRGVKC